MRRRLPWIAGAALVAASATAPAIADSAQESATHVLREGDTVRVEGTAVGCQVARRGSDLVVDCRRQGPLRGTYGTFFGERRLTVARFTSDDTARVVFTGRHGGRSRRCSRTDS